MQATDPDSGISGQVEYRIIPESHPSAVFVIDPIFGYLQVGLQQNLKMEFCKHNKIMNNFFPNLLETANFSSVSRF